MAVILSILYSPFSCCISPSSSCASWPCTHCSTSSTCETILNQSWKVLDHISLLVLISGDRPHIGWTLSAYYPPPPPTSLAPPILEDLDDDDVGGASRDIPVALAYAFTIATHSLGNSEPHLVLDALQRNLRVWKGKMQSTKELKSLWIMGTFIIADTLPSGCKAIGLCLILKIKQLMDFPFYRTQQGQHDHSWLTLYIWPGLWWRLSEIVKFILVCVLCALVVHFYFQPHFCHLDTNTASHNKDLDEELNIHLSELKSILGKRVPYESLSAI
jgi:hypothetical protein